MMSGRTIHGTEKSQSAMSITKSGWDVLSILTGNISLHVDNRKLIEKDLASGQLFILVKSADSLIPCGWNDFCLCIQNFFFFFHSASDQVVSWSITNIVMSSHR
jgi:hypothetical protein